ncbi:MAG: hypothetical protein ACWGNI_00330 [Desulfobacterales bacterium]
MDKIQYKINNTDLIIEHEQIPVDFLINIPIIENDKVIGRAILTKNVHLKPANGKPAEMSETVVLTDIIVYDPEDRGKGIGDRLMGFITSSGFFDIVITGISTEAGRALCLKWGFKQEVIKETKLLIWRKANSNVHID